MTLINDRVKNFDFLRGIAILGVIIVHVSQSFSTNIIAIDFLESFGRFGVQIFFFVSSLTMMRMYYLNNTFNISEFYIKRFSRILPLWIIFLIIYGLLEEKLFSYHSLMTLFFLNGFSIIAINEVIPGGWTISVEIMYYVLFPFIAKYFINSNKLILTAFFIYVFNIVALEPFIKLFVTEYSPIQIRDFFYMYFFNQLPIFLLGSALFLKLKNNENLFEYKVLILFIIWIIISYTICIVLDFKEMSHGPLFLLILICLYYGIAFCLKLSLNGRLVNFISLIGEYTYPMYLIHFLIIFLLVKILNSLDFNNYQLAVNLLIIIIVSAISFVLSIIIDKYIDSSLRNKMKKYLLIKVMSK